MTHLSNDELLEAAEDGRDRRSHLQTCESCRTQVDELRQVLRLTSDIALPEPSPLFWNHFSDRVRAAVAAEHAPQPPRWRVNFAWTASVVGALAIIVIGIAVTLRTAQPVGPVVPVLGVDGVAADNDLPLLNDDPTWALMGELAAQIEWEDAGEAGLTARPGSAEQALAQMSEDEQRQVVELLQLELQKIKSL
jgi:hypothetical protein